MKLFHICTIANKLDQYEEMKESFTQAGFDEGNCRYSLFDNLRENVFDPYKTFNHIQAATIEPYIIFCHQDVLLNQGYGFKQLVQRLEELDKLDANWAIAGNAGVNNNYEHVVRISDPCETANWLGTFPQQVHSLDENFLVIKTSSKILCSKDLAGFHFYATDLCLNAILKSYTCYVIDFHLTHLSGGRKERDFREAQANFHKKWRNEFDFCYVATVTGIRMCLSKYKFLQFLGSKRVITWFFSKKYVRKLVAPHV